MTIASVGPRDCAIARLADSELHTHLDVIATVVQLTAWQTVNCPDVAMAHRDCAFDGIC